MPSQHCWEQYSFDAVVKEALALGFLEWPALGQPLFFTRYFFGAFETTILLRDNKLVRKYSEAVQRTVASRPGVRAFTHEFMRLNLNDQLRCDVMELLLKASVNSCKQFLATPRCILGLLGAMLYMQHHHKDGVIV